jgi:hypothetical protein
VNLSQPRGQATGAEGGDFFVGPELGHDKDGTPAAPAADKPGETLLPGEIRKRPIAAGETGSARSL